MPTPDADPPFILEGPIVESITQDSAVVTWVTNEPADSTVNYSTTIELGFSVSDGSMVLLHRITLTGLFADTRYYVEVQSSDAASNGPTVSPMLSFSTLPILDVEAPLIIAGPIAIDITEEAATIIWTTDEPATSVVSFTDSITPGLAEDDAYVTEHSVRLTGLTPDTEYNYTVSSIDEHGNGPVTSDTKSFQTLSIGFTDPPLITMGPHLKNITQQHVVIEWWTNKDMDSVIEYGLTPALGEVEVQTQLRSHHNMTVTGLDEDTQYYFRVRSTDEDGVSL